MERTKCLGMDLIPRHYFLSFFISFEKLSKSNAASGIRGEERNKVVRKKKGQEEKYKKSAGLEGESVPELYQSGREHADPQGACNAEAQK